MDLHEKMNEYRDSHNVTCVADDRENRECPVCVPATFDKYMDAPICEYCPYCQALVSAGSAYREQLLNAFAVGYMVAGQLDSSESPNNTLNELSGMVCYLVGLLTAPQRQQVMDALAKEG